MSKLALKDPLKVIRSTFIIAGLLIAIFAFPTSSVEAHAAFKKYLSAKMPNKKLTCNLCHVPQQKKTVRNSYGQLFTKVMNKPNLTKDWKSKTGDAKKTYEKDVMVKEFDKAYKKISKMTFADLLKNDLIDGVKSNKPPAKPAEKSKETSFAKPPELSLIHI